MKKSDINLLQEAYGSIYQTKSVLSEATIQKIKEAVSSGKLGVILELAKNAGPEEVIDMLRTAKDASPAAAKKMAEQICSTNKSLCKKIANKLVKDAESGETDIGRPPRSDFMGDVESSGRGAADIPGIPGPNSPEMP